MVDVRERRSLDVHVPVPGRVREVERNQLLFHRFEEPVGPLGPACHQSVPRVQAEAQGRMLELPGDPLEVFGTRAEAPHFPRQKVQSCSTSSFRG